MTIYDIIFKILVITAFFLWQLYWWITEMKADREKPKTKTTRSFSVTIRKTLTYLFGFFLLAQFFGLTFFPIRGEAFFVELMGLFLVLSGVAISVIARIYLGTNWAHAAEYQIKERHALVTEGIYAYIRHPIYSGLILAYVGAELVAKSYLFIPLFFLMIFMFYQQGKSEEKILTAHFGKDYKDYMKRTKMFLPFVF